MHAHEAGSTALRVVIFLLVAMLSVVDGSASVRAERVRICDQTVDYTPTGIPADIQGVWIGRVSFDVRNWVCQGIVVEGLDGQQQIKAVRAWNANTPGSDIRNVLAVGTRAISIMRRSDGLYTAGPFSLRRDGDKLIGKMHSDRSSGDFPVELVLQR
jgi:hypothetical protein